MENNAKRLWLEETLSDNHRWSYRASRILYSGQSEYQDIDLADTPTWGKVLLLDGKMQSTEIDELLYHEHLVHPALLSHPNPKTVFIMGGGEGATAREVLRHPSVERVVMVDIDKVVCEACAIHLPRNTAAFVNPRLTLIHDDARAQLEQCALGSFDVIISDLCDPLDGGPAYQLYTQEFYANIVLTRLAPGGIFVTQSGPAGVLSCKEVFTCIHHTLASVFPAVVPYSVHVPSFCDEWGYCVAFRDIPSITGSSLLRGELLDAAAAARIDGELEHLDGQAFEGATHLGKVVRLALAAETETFTADSARFIHGAGNVVLAAPTEVASARAIVSVVGVVAAANSKADLVKASGQC